MELNQVLGALRNADAAGDVEAAKRLATIAKAMSGQAGPETIMSTEDLQNAKSAPTSISDIARSFGSGVVGATKSLADVFGAGSGVSNYLGEVNEGIQKGISPERQAEMARRAELSKRAEKEGTWAQIKSGLAGVAEAPLQSIAQGVGSSLPTIAAGLVALPEAAPAALALGVQRASQLLIAAAQGTGEVKGDIHDAIKQAYKEKGMDDAQANKLAIEAQEYTIKNAPTLIGGAAFGALDAMTGFEKSASKALRGAMTPEKTFTKEGLQAAIAELPKKAVEAPTYAGQALKTGISEAIPEGLQGGYGQLAQNVAMSQAGFETPTFQGVAGAAARDALVGALTGTAMSPLGHSVANAEFQADKYLRGVKAQQEFETQREEFNKTQEKTKENLGVNTLALGYEPKAEEEKYTNPAASIKKTDLLPDEVKFVDDYRKQNGLPPLKSYSIEDIKDAMPGVDPEGEQGRIDSILAAKYNYKPVDDNTGKPVNYTPDDVISAAEHEKNVATGTKGFNDFLTRVTGSSDLNTMSQPQLFAAFQAIKQMPESEEKQILPEGTGASRFTDKQYKKAVSWFGQTFEQFDNKPLSRETIIQDIQEATGLEQKHDAEALLSTAVKNGDLAETEEQVFRTYDDNGKLVSTYRDKAKADAAAKKQGLNVKEERLKQLTPPPAAEPAKRTNLPAGYEMTKETVKEGEVPVGFDIFPEGKGKSLFTVPTSEAVQAKIDELIPARKKEAARYLSYMDRDKATLQKARDSLVSMEARGEVGSQAYELAKTRLAKQERVLGNRILRSMERITEYEQPLISRPTEKKKQVTREKVTVTKGGKSLGSFPNNVKAQEAILVQMTDEELAETASDGRLGAIADRAAKEIERRKNPAGIMVKRSPKPVEETPPLAPEFVAAAEEIRKKLVPFLQRMGLGDVGLKIVESIQNGGEGSYGRSLIKLAMGADNPLETMHHESLHALKDLGFFTPQQWATLENQAEKVWIKKYLKNIQSEVVIDGVKKTMSRYDAYVALGYTPEAIREEAIADAFADFATPKAGMIASIIKRLNEFFRALKNAIMRSGFESAEDIFSKAQRGELKPNSWKATTEIKAEADAYDKENGILPYTSEGQIKIPLEGEGQKLSLKKPYDQKQLAKDQTLKNDPLTGLPMNANGTVTLYYPTTNEGARELARTKRLNAHSPEANRIYLTNESSAPAVTDNPGLIDQPLGGANVLLQVDPSMIHLLEEHADGRKDFFIPIAEGSVFAKKMAQTKMFTLNAPRTEGLHPDRTLSQVTSAITDTVDKWKNSTVAERKVMAKTAKDTLRADHNIEKLFGANSKLEKTNIGDYGLTYKGKKVMSTGLGFAAAQKINDEQRATTCPQSGICESLCLGETSGQNLLYGGEGQFRSGPRLSQYLKTEALVVNPEAFTVALIKQIDTFRNAANKLGYQPAIRLNVTSDFNPKTFEAIIKMFPDVMFYDYTKLDTKPIAPNHHLTYSSTGASQVVNGKTVENKFTNWDRMVDKVLPSGRNVAMAFSNRTEMPKFIKDERTGKTFEVWNGDEYDARFLDPQREDGTGWIIGLTNKDKTGKPEEAAEKNNGFFLDYDPARDGDTLTIPDQSKLKAGKPVTFAPKEKLSLRKAPDTPAFKQWFGKSKIVNPDGTPKVMYHGTSRDIGAFKPKQAGAIFLTDDPDFAAQFSQRSTDFMLNEIAKGIDSNPDEKRALITRLVDDAIANKKLATKENSNGLFDTTRKEHIEEFMNRPLSQSMGTVGIGNALTQELSDRMPSGQNIMPVYVKAENTFDYENPRHIKKIIDHFTEIDNDDIAWLKHGNWETIESEGVQDAIQFAGFDSFYVKEHGRKNLAVYEPSQIKSATGNKGTFDINEPDLRLSLRSVRQPPESKEFKQWFGLEATAKNKDGTPLMLYHGTAGNFNTFTPKVANAIFLTTDPDFAESFADISEDKMRKSAYKAMNRDDKAEMISRVAKAAEAKGDITAKESEQIQKDLKKRVPADLNHLPPELEQQILDELNSGYLPSRMNIMPVYTNVKNTWDYSNPNHIKRVMDYITNEPTSLNLGEMKYPDNRLAQIKGALTGKNAWRAIESDYVQEAIQALGFDSFTVSEGDVKNFGVFLPTNVKSATGNIGTFGLGEVSTEQAEQLGMTAEQARVAQAEGDIRLSLRASTPAAINAAIDRTTYVREEKGFVERMMDAISPKSWSDFRAKAMNRYNAMSLADKKRAEKMGGSVLLADQSAEAAALMSDLSAGVTASVLGVHDRHGGAPVFRNGVTTIDSSIKGPVAIFAPLAKRGDPRIYQMWQFYAGAKRARRYFKDGKEQNYTQADMALADQLGQQYPEFKQIFDEWNTFNDALVKYQVDTGVLSKEMADEYRKYSDYIPFYRQLEDEATLGPKVFQSISGVKGPKKLKGSEAPIADLMETIVRNVQSGIQSGMKNHAARQAITVFKDIGEAVPTFPTASGPSVVYVMENGKKAAYEVADHALYNSMQSLNLPELPFLGFFAGPANLLRNLVTKDPGFMLANMVRDSMSAWVTSGVKMTPVASAVKNFTGALRGTAPEYQALLNAGILGGYEFSQNVEASGKQLHKELAKYGPSTSFGKITKPFTSLWGALEKGTTASDAATRMEVYKNVLAETGNEAEALFRALEVMNFNRKGNSAVIRILTAAVPFLNARIQGLDVLYRASFGKMNSADAKAIQKSFFIRGATIMAMSMMYWGLTHDDDDYIKQEQETRDNYWLVPKLGIRIPIPFEVGVIFKVIPERIAELTMGTDTTKDFTKAMQRALQSTFGFNPVPQVALPVVEAVTNYSFFTGRAIVGQGLEGVAKEFQVGPSTSQLAKYLGSVTGQSPMMIDHIIGGYTGTFGMYAVDAIDAVVSANSDVPKASKRFEQMPVLRRFLLDPEARGNVTAYYDLKNATDEAVRTSNFLERTMNFEDYAQFNQDTIKMLASADFVKSLDKDMKELNELTGVIRHSGMSADEKRDAISALNQAQNNLTANIKLIKKSLD